MFTSTPKCFTQNIKAQNLINVDKMKFQFPHKSYDPLGRFRPQRHNMTKTGTSLQDNAIQQIPI